MGSSSIFNHLAQIAILTDSSLEETRHHQGPEVDDADSRLVRDGPFEVLGSSRFGGFNIERYARLLMKYVIFLNLRWKPKNFWNHRSWLIFVEPLEMNEPDTRRPAGAYVFT